MSTFTKLLELIGRGGEQIRFGVGTASGFSTSLVPWDSVDAAIEAANAASANLWFEVNPSSHGAAPGRTSASEVTKLVALWVDIDFKPKPGGMGSILEAEDLIDDLIGMLGVWPSAIVKSGHGLQPYWPIEPIEITDENRVEVATLLRRWGAAVQYAAKLHGGKVDSVFDLPRILRVPGSLNVKDRTKPVEVTVEFPPINAEGSRLTLEEIVEALDSNSIPAEPDEEIGGEVVSPVGAWDWAETDCHFVDVARREISTSKPDGRHPWALKWSATLHGMIRSGCVTEGTFYELRKMLDEKFVELCETQEPIRKPARQEIAQIHRFGLGKAQSWNEQKLADEMRQHTHQDFLDSFTPDPTLVPEGAQVVVDQSMSKPFAEPPAPNVVSIFSGRPVTESGPVTNGALALEVEVKVAQRLGLAAYTDTGNAERLAQQLMGRYLFVPSIGWHLWDGNRWRPDDSGAIIEQTKDLFMHMLANADGDSPKAKWAAQSLSKSRIAAAIDLCKTVSYLVKRPDELDSNAFEMATPQGIIDLRTGSIRLANPMSDFHTLSSTVAPDFDMPTPKFNAFLQWAMRGDEQMIAYLQHLFGMAAVGKVLWHIFPIFLGGGSNGKSTLLELIASVFGQYAKAMPDEFLVEKSGSSHPTEIAQLRGVRLATINEVPAGAKFNEALLKRITGERRLTGRFMGKDFIEFENRTTFVMSANELLTVRTGGKSFFRRVRRIDFTNSIAEGREDVNLVDDILKREAPGVLAWVVRGAQQALAYGIDEPIKVTTSTREYQLDEDAYSRFIAEYLVEEQGAVVGREHVYKVYRNWMFHQGLQPDTASKFARAIIQAIPAAGAGSRLQFADLRMAQDYYWAEETKR